MNGQKGELHLEVKVGEASEAHRPSCRKDELYLEYRVCQLRSMKALPNLRRKPHRGKTSGVGSVSLWETCNGHCVLLQRCSCSGRGIRLFFLSWTPRVEK